MHFPVVVSLAEVGIPAKEFRRIWCACSEAQETLSEQVCCKGVHLYVLEEEVPKIALSAEVDAITCCSDSAVLARASVGSYYKRQSNHFRVVSACVRSVSLRLM